MNFTRLLFYIGLSSFLFILTNCSEEPIQADLSSVGKSIDTLIITDISGYSYQVSPEISNYNKLYIGYQDEFSFSHSLFNFSSDGWNIFFDSTVTVDSMFFKVFSGDSLISNDIDLNLHFSNDSIFDENESLVTDLSEIDLTQWNNLGLPLVSLISDTSDTVSHFQETVLSWDISSSVNSLIDTSNLHRTFSISLGPQQTDSFVELFSREYSSGSLDPKIEVYYRREIGSNPDSSIIDSLTRIVYVAEDISVIEIVEIDTIEDNLIFLSRARGSRAILDIPFDSLSLPQYSVIRSANLTLYSSNDSLESFSVRMDPLKIIPDTVSSVLNSDPFDNLNMHFSSASIVEGELKLSLKSYLQSILMTDSLKNTGFKFSSSTNNDLFESIIFDLGNFNNRLEIFYVSP
tara:strand:+ start:192 stop:1403 length:1212 start_codon:yes stop_codon:yes gene_type:complete